MSRTIVDENLLEWEVYPSGSRRGFAERPVVIFRCATDRSRRARFIEVEGDVASAERLVGSISAEGLRDMLVQAAELP